MTIRIVDEKPDPSLIKQVICNRCGVKLEYLPLDIKYNHTPHEWGGYDTDSYINCLKCNNRIIV